MHTQPFSQTGYSTLAESLVKMIPKLPNKYSINTIFKHYEHMILSDYFHLTSFSENPILIIWKTTQVLKAAGRFQSVWTFSKGWSKILVQIYYLQKTLLR